MATKSIFYKLKQVLSHPKTGLIVLLLAMTGRVLQVLYFFNIRSDRSFQLLATDSFLNDHGISTAHVLAHDLSTVLYEPLIKWPPGYSLLLSAFYWLFGRDYIAAALTLDILSALVFLLFCRAIVKILGLPQYLINGLTLSAGLFIYDFYLISSTDAIGITLFLAGLYPALLLLKREDREKQYGIMAGVALLACALFKYVFLMAVIVVPLFLFFKGWVDNKASIKRGGMISLTVLMLGLGVMFLYQKSLPARGGYISDVVAGFSPKNLLSAYPFLPASFIKPDTVVKIMGFDWRFEAFVVQVFQGMHLLMLLLVFIVIVKMMLRLGVKQIPITESFFFLCFFTSFALVGLLTIMSLRYAKAQELPGIWWTYIQESRYYGLPNVLIHLSVFVLFLYGKIKRVKVLKYAAGVLLLVLFVEVVRGGLFTANRLLKLGKEEYSWQYEDWFQKQAADVITKARKEQRVNKVVVTSPSYYYANRVALHSHVFILEETDKINNLANLSSKEPVLLLVMLHQKDLRQFQAFLSQYGRTPSGKFHQYTFYTVYVTPH